MVCMIYLIAARFLHASVCACVQLTFMGFHLHFRNHTHGWPAKIHVFRHDLLKALLLYTTRRLAGAAVGELADMTCLYAVSKIANCCCCLVFLIVAAVVFFDVAAASAIPLLPLLWVFVVVFIFLLFLYAYYNYRCSGYCFCCRHYCALLFSLLLLFSLACSCKCSYLFLRLSPNINKELTLIPIEFAQTFDSCAKPKAKLAEAANVKAENTARNEALRMQHNNKAGSKALGGLGRFQVYCNLDATAALEIAKLLLEMLRCLRDVLRWILLKRTADTYNVASIHMTHMFVKNWTTTIS